MLLSGIRPPIKDGEVPTPPSGSRGAGSHRRSGGPVGMSAPRVQMRPQMQLKHARMGARDVADGVREVEEWHCATSVAREAQARVVAAITAREALVHSLRNLLPWPRGPGSRQEADEEVAENLPTLRRTVMERGRAGRGGVVRARGWAERERALDHPIPMHAR